MGLDKESLAKYAIKHALEPFNVLNEAHATKEIPKPVQQEQPSRKWWTSRAPKPESILSTKEQNILKKVKSRAYFLDRGISCCCMQIGFDGLVGFVPVIGDFIGLVLAFQLVEMCMRAGLPKSILSQMMFNIGIDFAIGLVPIVGDILDIFYKCNTRNAILLERYLLQRRQEELACEPSLSSKAPLLSSSNSAPIVMENIHSPGSSHIQQNNNYHHHQNSNHLP
ncbi:hypothetical protein CLU79DRAFT_747882 [Phycomyces nitens]|nr:hypothetical protein CLU79DRAFT_747882 [Phycomyces nitens]